MFDRLLIANRGEIACRILRTARRLGIHTIAVYSDADAGARHVRLADEAVRIGPAAARESYLSIEKIIDAARRTNAQALHPGYGFLSENADLADACVAAGVTFVGPTADAIRAMGSKSSAKKLMVAANVPVTPGYHGDNQDPGFLQEKAGEIGYPVLIKASAGGGGKGMRRVDAAADFDAALASCRREAQSSFGSDLVLIEKYVMKPRHVEVQIFGDTQGNFVHLFERDCSVQRRHQKVIEEAPAPGMTESLRVKMGETAVLAAKTVKYVGAGTVEFILDHSGHFYFMEMNTRLQVEHPVTEEITGQDLVEWQLRVASGEPLPRSQSELQLRGHAIEARIYAENPDAGFTPSVGTLLHLSPPDTSPASGVRLETGVDQGDAITADYDPMIAKLITWGRDRDEALRKMQSALAHYEVVGVGTNIEFLGRLLGTRSFTTADLDTSLIEREHEALLPPLAEIPDDVWRLAAVAELTRASRHAQMSEPGSPWSTLDGFRLNGRAKNVVSLRSGEAAREAVATWKAASTYEISLNEGAASLVHFTTGDDWTVVATMNERAVHAHVIPNDERARWEVFTGGRRYELEPFDPLDIEVGESAAQGGMRAPMSGKVIAHLAAPGAKVTKGTALLVMEAMKMEITIVAPHAGTLASFRYAPGEQVTEGSELAIVDKEVA